MAELSTDDDEWTFLEAAAPGAITGITVTVSEFGDAEQSVRAFALRHHHGILPVPDDLSQELERRGFDLAELESRASEIVRSS